MRPFHLAAAILTIAAAPASGVAQEFADVELGGEVRPRFESRMPGWLELDDAVAFTSMRSRLSLRAEFDDYVDAFVQLQDVRIWGSELGTTDPSADMFDVHQAWIQFGDPREPGVAFRAGRQELAYGEERLVGALNWAQQARAFDGARLRLHGVDGSTLDVIGMRLQEGQVRPPSRSFLGLYGFMPLVGETELYTLRIIEADQVPDPMDMTTAGARWSAGAGRIDWRVEAAYQWGERAGRTVTAYLLALRAGLSDGERLRADLWYDRLSGGDPEDPFIRVFDTLFATNHKFYGHMDLFTDIPAHTQGRGLQDLAVKTRARLGPEVDLTGDLHAFYLTYPNPNGHRHLGEELDFGLTWRYAQGVSLSGGLSWFSPGGSWPGPEGNRSFVYTMIEAIF